MRQHFSTFAPFFLNTGASSHLLFPLGPLLIRVILPVSYLILIYQFNAYPDVTTFLPHSERQTYNYNQLLLIYSLKKNFPLLLSLISLGQPHPIQWVLVGLF